MVSACVISRHFSIIALHGQTTSDMVFTYSLMTDKRVLKEKKWCASDTMVLFQGS